VSPKPTLFIIDDDADVRTGLCRLARSADCRAGPFASADDFLAAALSHPGPACLILDVRMPGLDGLGLQQKLAAQGRHWPIIFLTGYGNIPLTVRAMKAGAVDFLTKPCLDTDLLAAIERALAKHREQHQQQTAAADCQTRLASLTRRERQVLALVAAGRLNKQIAHELGTCEQTIKVHRMHITEKLGVHSTAELARLAEKAGLLADSAMA
jgi:FixJ family two-component response regulator